MKSTILLACSDVDKEPIFLEQLEADAYTVIKTDSAQALRPKNPHLLLPAVLVLYETAVPDGQVELIRRLQDSQPVPIVLFIEQCNQNEISDYVIAGVTSLIVNNFEPHRFDSIIQTAKTRFEKCQHLKGKLSATEQRLEDRRLVEKAKGIIMTGKQLNEDEAYKLLRSMAMEKNIKMGDLAKSVIAASELLS